MKLSTIAWCAATLPALICTVDAAIVDAATVTSVAINAPLYDSSLNDSGGCDPAGCVGELTWGGKLFAFCAPDYADSVLILRAR